MLFTLSPEIFKYLLCEHFGNRIEFGFARSLNGANPNEPGLQNAFFRGEMSVLRMHNGCILLRKVFLKIKMSDSTFFNRGAFEYDKN